MPIFKVSVNLAIPNITIVPTLEEVQQALNRAVECVVSVSNGVGQWSMVKEKLMRDPTSKVKESTGWVH